MKIILSGIVYAVLFFSLIACKNSSKESGFKEKRVASLSPHITEIIYAWGAEKDLIAVTDYCRYPRAARKKEKIGGLINPNIEKIVALAPTYLIGVPAHAKLSNELAKFDLSIIMLPNENISDVLTTIDTIGTILDCDNQADLLIQSIRDSLQTLIASPPKTQPGAILVIGRENGSLRNVTAAGDDTFINELWEIAGGKNTFSDLPSRYGSVNIESLLKRDPEIIIEFDMKSGSGVFKLKSGNSWEQFENMTAVKNANLYKIGGDHTLIPGPRLISLARDFRYIIKNVTEH